MAIFELSPIFKDLYGKELEIKIKDDVDKLVAIVNDCVKTETIGINGAKIHHDIKITYTESNLGKGFIFWFECSKCGCKTKSLYTPNGSEKPYCRSCHRLSYKKQNLARDKTVAMLLKNMYLIPAYLESGDHKQVLAALEASIYLEREKDIIMNKF